jgi:hypothetical protein
MDSTDKKIIAEELGLKSDETASMEEANNKIKLSFSIGKKKNCRCSPYKYFIIDLSCSQMKTKHIFNKLIPSLKEAIKGSVYTKEAKELKFFVIHEFDEKSEDLIEL